MSLNELTCIPSTMQHMKFETLDITTKKSTNTVLPRRPINVRRMLNLWELAGQAVIVNRLPYNYESMPQVLVDILDRTPQCDCGHPCFSAHIRENRKHIHLFNAKECMNEHLLAEVILCNRCALRDRCR